MHRFNRSRGAAAVAMCLLAATLAMPASAQKVEIKIGHPLTTNSGLQQWAVYFKDALGAKMPGKFDVRIFPTSTLGSIPRMIEGAQLGTIEMIEVPPAFLSGVDPRFSILAAPGIFADITQGQRTAHDPEFKKAFWGIGEAKGLKMVGLTCDSNSDYATTTPVRKIADFRGLKIRVFGSKLEIETMHRLGATGVPMPLSSVIPALQQHTIDGNKAGIVVFVPFKYQTVAKYIIKLKSSIICVCKFASKVWLDRLAADQQQAVAAAAAVADDKVLPWSVAFNNRLYGLWVKGGGELAELSKAEQTEVDRRLSTVGDDVLKSDPKVFKVYEIMKKVAARYRGS